MYLSFVISSMRRLFYPFIHPSMESLNSHPSMTAFASRGMSDTPPASEVLLPTCRR